MPQITERVYHIPTRFFVNLYLIRGNDGYTLVDAGISYKGVVNPISEALRHWGVDWDAIQSIIITHGHFDHIGGLRAIHERTEAIIYAHPADTPIIEGRQKPIFADPIDLGIRDKIFRRFAINSQAEPTEIDILIDEGDKLDGVAPGAEVIHLPGHSYGQIGLWLPEERTLIAGDAMMHMPWGLTGPFRIASPDWADVYRSIERVAQCAPDNLCLGHGAPITGNASTLVQRFYERWQDA